MLTPVTAITIFLPIELLKKCISNPSFTRVVDFIEHKIKRKKQANLKLKSSEMPHFVQFYYLKNKVVGNLLIGMTNIMTLKGCLL